MGTGKVRVRVRVRVCKGNDNAFKALFGAELITFMRYKLDCTLMQVSELNSA